jgi:hypothetical protein
MSNHTPGPWHRNIKPAARYPVIFAGRNSHVAQVISSGLTDEAIEANCNLIAAAPDLLAALQGAMFFVPLGTKARDAANAAIDRATGESQ